MKAKIPNYQSIYDEVYYTTGNYKQYQGFLFRFYHLVRYFILGLFYKYFFKANTILDLGCATGMSVWVFRKLLKMEAYGVDVSEYAIKSGIKSIRKYLFRQNISDVTFRLPLKRFDLIVSYDTLEHLEPEKVDRAIINIFSLTDKAILGIYTLDETIASFHNLLGLIHKSHFSEHSSAWWIDKFASHNLTATHMLFARRGSLLVRNKNVSYWR